MANVAGYYDVPLFSATALQFMMDGLGTARRVNRKYEAERSTFRQGSSVKIRRPASVAVKAMPIAANQVDDLQPDTIDIALNNWQGDVIGITDQEQAFLGDAFINEHAPVAGYALARAIEASLLALAPEFPNAQAIVGASATPAVLTRADRIMQELAVPDEAMRKHYVTQPDVWEAWLNSTNFAQFQGAGPTGVQTQTTAQIGVKYGFQPYRSNLLPSLAAFTPPTITTPAFAANFAKGVQTITLAAATLTGDFKRGMVIHIGTSTAGTPAWRKELYAITTASVTASGNAATVGISPPLRTAITAGDAWDRVIVATDSANRCELAFHENALAICTVPLDQNLPGVIVSTANHMESGLSLRSMIYYDPHLAKKFLRFDALWGVKVLDPYMGVRGAVTG